MATWVWSMIQCMGDFPKALEYHNRDLEIKIQVFGPEHLVVAETKTNIGSVYYSQA